MLAIDESRKQILAASRHTLVTGGPGSGKTTIGLLKSLNKIQLGLKNGQSILFLSFSRAAVLRISSASQNELPQANQKQLSIQTFHAFFWEFLRTNAYLLGSPKHLSLLAPHDERSLSNGISREHPAWKVWEQERQRLFLEEGRIAFDLFATNALELLKKSTKIRKLVCERYPLIILDEAQDTGPEQWACIKMLAEFSQILCLADLDQQIFDHLPGVGPERIKQIQVDLDPLVVDLGTDNKRSPDSEILTFGNDILSDKVRSGSYKDVSMLNYSPQATKRDDWIRKSIGIIRQRVTSSTGIAPKNIAILASYGSGVAVISNALTNNGIPIPHTVVFDETATLLSSRLLAFLLEPKYPTTRTKDLAQAFDYLGLKMQAGGTASKLEEAKKIRLLAENILEGKITRKTKLYSGMCSLFDELEKLQFSGIPAKDWMHLRKLLRNTNSSELLSIEGDLDYLVAFKRGNRITAGLSSSWENYGCYINARKILEDALAEEQIMPAAEDISGIHVMTVHKSKGKQFDAVIIFRNEHSSPFIWKNDNAPYHRSRKILRVAITRARIHTLILNQVFPKCPILSKYNL